LDWHAIDWRAVEEDVRRLRQRIFTASQVGDLKRVRSLQKLMLRSRANTLLSVRRVTEVNAGRKTAGVDGKVVLLSSVKAELADWVQRNAKPWQARPVRRVYIPKKGGRRPLGIPVIVDRVLQARVVNALEPEWEARFEPKSYGFRPGRGCHDAIEAIFSVAKGANPRRRWVLDADLAAAFDRIDHDHLLSMLGTFPAKGTDRRLAEGGCGRGRSVHPDPRAGSSGDDRPLTRMCRTIFVHGPVLGRSATQGTTPAHGQGQPAFAVCAALALPNLSGAPAARRPSATKPTRVGTVAGGHPQGDSQELPHRAGGRHA